MKTLTLTLFLTAALFAAQEGAAPGHEAPAAHEAQQGGHEGGEHSNTKETIWKIVNFAILAVGIGYLAGKNAPAFFRGRTNEIQQGIREASQLRSEAEAKAADIEARMKNLSVEIASLRKYAAEESAREAESIKAETEHSLAKITAQAQQDIATYAKSARQELKAFSARVAIELAAEKIRAQINPESQDALLQGFVSDLGRNAKPEVH
jgi:F-type H+-transporting ATPase subunit b